MKKSLFLTLALLALSALATSANAQKVTLSTGPENKSFDIKTALETTIIDEDASSIVLLTREEKNFFQGGADPDIKVCRMDKGLNIIQEHVIVNSKDCDLFGFGTTDTTISVLLCDKEKKSTMLSRSIIDRRTFNVVNEGVVHTFNFSRKDRDYLWHVTSSNGQYTAVVSLLVLHSNEYMCDVLMFDNSMRLLWMKQHPLKGVTDLFITDNGELYTMAVNRRDMQTTIHLDKFADGNAETAQVEIPDGINTATIANVKNGRIVIGGTLRYIEARRTEMQTNGVFGLSYDMNAHQIVKFSMAQLHHDDLVVLNDKKQSAKTRKEYVDALIVEQTCPTDFGGAFVFTKPFAVQKTSSNGEVTTYYYRTGLVVLGVDFDGNVTYKVPIRHYTMQTNGSNELKIPLISKGGNAYLFHTEHPKTDQSYNIAKKTKCVKVPSDKVNTAMYSISPVGYTQKTVLSQKQKNFILGPSHAWYNDKNFMIHTASKACHLIQVKAE